MGIGVYFQEQNLDTLKMESEMVIGFHSVMAQAESENISANVKWGIHQRMRTGTYAFRYNILGYRKGENGEPEIVPEEADIVKEIFQKYLAGDTTDQIKAYLEGNGYLTKKGEKRMEQREHIQYPYERTVLRRRDLSENICRELHHKKGETKPRRTDKVFGNE